MKKVLLAFLFTPLFTFSSFASHLMGGEITWTCLGTGQFVFTLKLYRDCNGIPAPGSANLSVFYCPGLTNIPMNLIAGSPTDESPVCNPAGPAITCDSAMNEPGWPNSGTPELGAMAEYIYQSAPITISGTPPATGWIFTFNYCCRSSLLNNLAGASGDLGMTLRAKMFAYQGRNTNPCYSSSPDFFEKPKAVSCTGFPFTFNQNAVSVDLDSLNYAWAEPLDTVGADGCGALFTATCPPALPFAPNYSYNNPLPGPSIDARNVAAQLNPNTGEITYTSFTQGYFVMVVQVSAYKCGSLVSQVYREIQVILAGCADITPNNPNHPPVVVPPFSSSLGPHTSYVDTVYAGDLVDFFLTCSDTDRTPSGGYQNLTMTAIGPEFDSTFTNTNGVCLLPPCATLTPPPALLTGQDSLRTEFKWKTSCDHLGVSLGCRTFSNIYNFIIKSSDDFCPIPGTTLSTITIVLLPPPPLTPPDLKCAAVSSTGDSTTISWVPSSDTATGFHGYDIYYSSNDSNFTVIGSVLNYSQTSYILDTVPGYYYIAVHSNCPVPNSDTLEAIHLTASNPATGYAVLNWNATHTPPLSSNSLYYYIYKQYPAGTGAWTFLDSTKSTNYSDPITICTAMINYYVTVSDSSGCTSVSNVAGNTFHGVLAPAAPILDSVSVNAAGMATIGWQRDTSSNVIGYYIYICNNGGGSCTAIDTIMGINNTSFTTSVDATARADSFSIAAFDSCQFKTSPLSVAQNTIHVTGSYDICTDRASLSWNAYINWSAGVKEYKVFVSINGAPYNFIGSSTSTGFVQDSLSANSSYCYLVQAIDGNNTRSSSSNRFCLSIGQTLKPQFQYVRKATVIDDNTALIVAYVDTTVNVAFYKIMRSSEMGGPYDVVGTVVHTPGSTFIAFTDNNVPVSQRSYYYRVIAEDSCGNNIFASQYGKTIHATVTPNPDLSNTINWNDYEIWLGSVDHYNVYRNIDGTVDPVPVATIPFGKPLTFNDNVSNFIQASGKFCYYIEAVEGAGDIYGFVDSSYSNLACADQKPDVFIPNAFHPDGTQNTLFMPFSLFVNAQAYSINIYNRWGELVFKSDNPKVGWDGTYKGHESPEGVYVYFATITGTDGSTMQRKGTITLIR